MVGEQHRICCEAVDVRGCVPGIAIAAEVVCTCCINHDDGNARTVERPAQHRRRSAVRARILWPRAMCSLLQECRAREEDKCHGQRPQHAVSSWRYCRPPDDTVRPMQAQSAELGRGGRPREGACGDRLRGYHGAQGPFLLRVYSFAPQAPFTSMPPNGGRQAFFRVGASLGLRSASSEGGECATEAGWKQPRLQPGA